MAVMDPGKGCHLPYDINEVKDHFKCTLRRNLSCSSAEWLSDYNHNPNQLFDVPFSTVFDDDKLFPGENQSIGTSKCNEYTNPIMQQENDQIRRSLEQSTTNPVTNKRHFKNSSQFDDPIVHNIKSIAIPAKTPINAIHDDWTIGKLEGVEKFKEHPLHPLVSYDDSLSSDMRQGGGNMIVSIVEEGGEKLNVNITNVDVLCCRGGKGNKHEGNIRYLKLVRNQKKKYRSLSKKEKSEFALSIVRQVQSSGGRFLKYQNNSWEEISDETARKKVSAALRE